ncbi:MAG: diaminopimelate decarboxylase [Lysobacterales bacterium CG17_big_fil_post_rev_8_21_14_2_50_64_11]|nr:MAG: diaminopimelate decarboxylase [Xanthomonadales bacterium CG17_big_fil_post_rev_8_21_14_2_50_64_11]PIX60956.1 MAG: diaminopimelate decarboxylase [Xanthomonadales bacterium CG_4_10_14_3_um_filter_64_11]
MNPNPVSTAAQPGGWIVLKFGGTSVSRRSRWDTIAALMQQRAAENDARVLVVVSALSGTTNALQSVIEQHADVAAVRATIAQIIARHVAMLAELGLDADTVLAARFAELTALADDPGRLSAELPWQTRVLAQGELLSSTLGVAYLRARGIDVHWLDARDWLRARAEPNQNAASRWLLANCDGHADADAAAKLAGIGRLLLTQGFIVRAHDGGTAILGRGGSDTSAAYFGALLRARRVEIWTDVPGMFSANPRQVPDARLLARLDFEEGQEIASTGAKVLHPRCIPPCREAAVPVWIRDTENPDLLGTVIGASADARPGVKAISSRRGIVLVSMESIGMWQQVGFLADIFERFKRHGLSVDLIGSSESNVTVSLDPSENLVSSNVLDALCADLALVCRVKVIAPCAAVTLVGRGMRSLLHRLSDVLAEFGRERVHLISQSSNDLNLTFVVDEALADGLLPHLHGLLIQSGAMPVDDAVVFGPSWRQLSRPEVVRDPPWWQAQRERLLQVAAQGTPRYVYHLPTLRQRAAALLAIDAVDRCLYAIKANAHPALLRALDQLGIGFECVSAGELGHLFSVLPQLAPQRVLFTPSFAPRQEYEQALARGVFVTVDSVEILQRWPQIFTDRAIVLRIDPGFGHGHHEKVRTGGKGAKFGLAPDRLSAFVAAANAISARIVGLHAHIGSGILDAGHWREVYAQLAAVAESIGSVSFIDVGGGLGVPYEPQAEPFDIAAYARVLAEVKAAYPQYALWIEPGRYQVAEAGVLLTRVTQVIVKSGVRRVGLDAGMNALMRPTLYNAWHEIVNLSRLAEPPGPPADVVGPVCESGDVLGRRRRLPASSGEGDVVLIATAGAYGAVMANTYNRRELPAEDAIDD